MEKELIIDVDGVLSAHNNRNNMKTILILAIMLFTAMIAKCQVPGTGFKTVGVSTWKFNSTTNQLTPYLGNGTWLWMVSQPQIAMTLDSIKNMVYGNHITDSLLMEEKLSTKLNTSLKGSSNGVAELDAGGKVPLTQINDALIGAVKYQGTYNASTNTPSLPDASVSKGWYYIVSTDGIQNSIDYGSNDWIISNGMTWGKVKATAYSIQYEYEVLADGQTTFLLPFSLSSKSRVSYNGILLRSIMWFGIGSSSITLNMDTKIHDIINIQN